MNQKEIMSRLMFHNLTKVTKILMRKNPMQQVLFHFSRSISSFKILISIKTSSNIKNCFEVSL